MHKKIESMVRRMAEKQSLHCSRQIKKNKSNRGTRRGKKIKEEPWSLYILECGDGSLYTGVTNNLTNRFQKHSMGKGSKYTRSHLPVELVYSELCGTRVDALVREMEVKSYAKAKKRKLINSACVSF